MGDWDQAIWQQIMHTVPGQYVNHHGVCLVGIGVAPAVVESLRQRNLLILGFEGFKVDGTHRQPDLGAIADLSEIGGRFGDAVRQAAEASVCILRLLEGEPLFFEFVIQSEDEYRSVR